MSGSRPYVMTRAEKLARIERIVSLCREGTAPYDIARKFSLTPNYVKAVLRSSGVTDLEPKAYGNDVDDIWALPEGDRRVAFAQRAAEGARETLRRAELSTLSTVVTGTGTERA